jgi:hypothetical protein
MISGLVGLTSLAVGATTSPWLVPLYLAAMAWLLVAPSSERTVDDTAKCEGGQVASPLVDPEPSPPGEAGFSGAAPSGEVAKPKSARSRGRKPKAKPKPEAPVEKTAATWVQVAPGKFVRVEIPVEATLAEEIDTALPTDSQEVGPIADVPADAEPQSTDPDASSEAPANPPDRRETWGETTLITEDEPFHDPVFVDPPEPARLVAVDESARPIQPRVRLARSAWVRPDPRPRLRRGNGRVGAVPRVVLHRG